MSSLLEEDYTHDKDVVIAKVVAGLGLFIVSTICGVIPFKLAKIFKWTEPIDPNSKSEKKSAKVVSVLLCFGGGVLLATTFLHLLPDINGEIAELKEEGRIPEWNLELGELLMMLGFFLIYLIEEIVHHYLHRYQAKSKKKSQNSVATMKPEEETYAEALMRGISARNSVHRRFSDVSCMNPVSCISPEHSDSQRGSTFDLSNNTKSLSVTEKGQIEMTPTEKLEKGHSNNSQNNHQHHSHENGQDQGHGHSHAMPIPHSDDEDMLVASLRGLLIVLALSIHELFEGFAVGLQKTSSGVYYMFAAVAAHKFVISFCIGVELMVQRTKVWLAFIYVFVYSFVSAFGILVGGILTTGSMGDRLQVPNVILQGFATGTLLYVIFFEVLSKDRSGMLPYLSVFGGFIIMAGLQYIAGITESQGLTISLPNEGFSSIDTLHTRG